ncbi:hypothetical protein [Nocardioides donggukensis]|uniref:Uncharacterized protein n=1 Tax=Nocardioides donggukensis TaxID=2774019 RepID=A0A927Q154_9ACTN|nr:hypothetical protein [Nocardioides donggukensis]MBD8869144.1 hypothetical protein [Nocardioides donggukensis]
MSVETRLASARRVPAWVLVALAVQIAVPLAVTVGDPIPSRFGFHMYTDLNPVEFDLYDASGAELEPDRVAVARLRPEIDWTGPLPEYLCDRFPEAAEVRVRDGEGERSLTCRP